MNEFFLDMKILFAALLILVSPAALAQAKWTYIMADSTRTKWGDYDKPDWLRYYGLDFYDIDGDDDLDIVAGRYVYHNAGGKMEGLWKRTDLGRNVDGQLFVNVDDDEFADIIAEALPDVYWLEATNRAGTAWSPRIVAQIPRMGHVNGQGYRLGDVFAGGKPEVLLVSSEGIFALEIPAAPNQTAVWAKTLLCDGASDEGFAVADMDRDGDLDIVAGMDDPKTKEPTSLFWYENPSNGQGMWQKHLIGKTAQSIDRVEVADFDGDQRPDVAITEERYPGLAPDASLVWFRNDGGGNWTANRLITQYSLNNLDAADLDQDGDIDLVTNEHKGQTFKLQIFENNGKGQFTERVIDTGKEGHLGTQLADLDNDGDLDIISAAWDKYKLLHIWRNDNPKK
jgi:hypothetical protein